MKVIDWVNCYSKSENFEELTNEEFVEAWKTVIKDVRNNGYHFTGSYHQYGEYGLPVLDNGKALFLSQRQWGRLMAEAYPEEFDNPDDEFNYVEWYIGPSDQSKCKYPKGDE